MVQPQKYSCRFSFSFPLSSLSSRKLGAEEVARQLVQSRESEAQQRADAVEQERERERYKETVQSSPNVLAINCAHCTLCCSCMVVFFVGQDFCFIYTISWFRFRGTCRSLVLVIP